MDKSAKVHPNHRSFVPGSLKQTDHGFNKLANRSPLYSQDAYDPVRKGIDAFARLHHCEYVAWLHLLDGGRLEPVHPSSPKSVLLRFLHGSLNGFPGLLEKVGQSIPAYWQRKETAPVSTENVQCAPINSMTVFPHSQDGFGQTVLILASRHQEIACSQDFAAQANLLLDLMVNAEQARRSVEMVHSSTYTEELLLASVPFPLAMLDASGKILSANPHFQTALGYSQQELAAMQYSQLAAWHSGAAMRKKGSDHSLGDPQDQLLTRKDGSPLHAHVAVTTMDGLGSRQLVALKTASGIETREREIEQRKHQIRVLTAQLLRSQEDERKRLSRELHDDIGQRLSLVTSQIASLTDDSLLLPDTCSGQLKHIHDELDALCTDLHEMSHNLHSYKLQHLGLAPAMRAMCRDFERPVFHVDLHIDDFAESVSEDIALCLYRIAQEALNNALHHANTEKACVVVTKLGSTYYMSIQDAGCGFDTGIAKAGLGLISMTERVKLLNGEFRVHSMKGRGTEIWASIPDGVASGLTSA